MAARARPRIATPRGAGAVIALAAGLALAACGSISDVGDYALVLQDRYAYSSCQEIASTRVAQINREKELVGLIEKADTGFGGFLVSTTTYRTELEQVRSHLRALARAARDKGCDAPAK
jgi:hypothetical protein